MYDITNYFQVAIFTFSERDKKEKKEKKERSHTQAYVNLPRSQTRESALTGL